MRGFNLLFLLPFSWIFGSCAYKAIPVPAPTLVEKITATRTDKGDYELKFISDGPWEIYQGDNPESINWQQKITTVSGKQVLIPNRDKRRKYFGIISPDKGHLVVSERKINLKGTPNFRDVGGLPTEDGRYVKWGLIYRSGKLSDLTKKDINYLMHLQLRSICDFRYDQEIVKDPDWIPPGANYYKFPIGGDDGKEYDEIRRQVLKKEIRGEVAKAKFVEIMELFADSVADDFKPVMDLLRKEENVPLVFHCSGGKDRTGFMASIILASLGVDRTTVKNEYLMSNFYRYYANKRTVRKAMLIGLDAETLHYAFVVQKEYIDVVFDLIDQEYGGVENYLAIKFGLSSLDIQDLRKKYTFSWN